MATPKAFISYSWTNAAHENWVLRLATDLVEAGVDTIIDKWDLKEGHDATAFMERMVTDPEIKKLFWFVIDLTQRKQMTVKAASELKLKSFRQRYTRQRNKINLSLSLPKMMKMEILFFQHIMNLEYS